MVVLVEVLSPDSPLGWNPIIPQGRTERLDLKKLERNDFLVGEEMSVWVWPDWQEEPHRVAIAG